MSNTLALLREAANEVANEEKEAADEVFQVAAEEANQAVVGELSSKVGESVSERSKSVAHVNVNEDVHALLEQMSIKPKYSGNTIDDVDALLGMQKKKSGKGDSRASMDLYRKRRSMRDAQLASKSVTSNKTWGEQSTGSFEQSRVSLLLSIADEKPWGQDIRYSFASPQQELLFRSMKVVRPNSKKSKSAGTATVTSLTLRLQKFQTSDLSLHASKRPGEEVEQRNKQHEHMRQSAERLCVSYPRQPSAADLKVDPTLTFSRYDDAKECTFQPRIAGAKQSRRGKHNDDDDVKEDKFAFLNRQEAEERNRRDEIEFQIGKANYDARVDKKACPQCGSKQSYDEFKEKRKSCVICNVEFCSKISWNKVGKRFFRSSLEYSQRVAEKKAALREELDSECKSVQRTERDPRTGKSVTYKAVPKQKLTPAEELEFFDRIDSMLQKREAKVKALEEAIYKEKCPFKPVTSSTNKGHKHGPDEEDQEEPENSDDEENGNGSNPVVAFLKRYKDDLESRKDKFPTKYIRSKIHNDELQPFRVTKSIDRSTAEALS